jgi:hypothetical protein
MVDPTAEAIPIIDAADASWCSFAARGTALLSAGFASCENAETRKTRTNIELTLVSKAVGTMKHANAARTWMQQLPGALASSPRSPPRTGRTWLRAPGRRLSSEMNRVLSPPSRQQQRELRTWLRLLPRPPAPSSRGGAGNVGYVRLKCQGGSARTEQTHGLPAARRICRIFGRQARGDGERTRVETSVLWLVWPSLRTFHARARERRNLQAVLPTDSQWPSRLLR